MSKTVEILLREDVEHLGHCGDVVRVASGYARNYLLPNRLAQEANPETVKMISRRRERFTAARVERMKVYTAQADALVGASLHTIENADRDGRLYGSVSAGTIVRLMAEAGHTIEERQVRLDGPVKSTGQTEVVIHIFGDINVTVPLMVEPEGGFPEPEPEPEAPAEGEGDDAIQMPEESLND